MKKKNPLCHTFIEKFNIFILSIIMNFVPLTLFAHSQKIIGYQGQNLGEELIERFKLPHFVDENDAKAGIVFNVFDEEITIETSIFEPIDNESESTETLLDYFDNDKELLIDSDKKQQSLIDENHPTGQAFRLFNYIDARARPDLSQDPIFSLSELLLTDHKISVGDKFEACETLSSKTQFKQCDRFEIGTKPCQIKHDFQAGVIEHIEGPLNLSSCGEGCLYVWIGQVGDNYWRGNCTIFEEFIQFKVINPDAINQVTLEYAKWDDYMQIWLNDNKVWSGPNDLFPPDTEGPCELSTNWEWTLDKDLTDHFKHIDINETLNFKMRVSVTGLGEGYARLKILYDPKKILIKDEWYPKSCIEKAKLFQNQFEQVNISCLSQAEFTNSCGIINGITVCEDNFNKSPIEGITPFCRLVEVSAQEESYQKGEGVLCQSLENDNACGFHASECVELNLETNSCHKFREHYQCGLNNIPDGCTVSSLFPTSFEACDVIEKYYQEEDTKRIDNFFTCEKMYEWGTLNHLVNQTDNPFNKPSFITPNPFLLVYDGCQLYEQNPQCYRYADKCLNEDDSDNSNPPNPSLCQNQEITFNCPEEIVTPNIKKERIYQCEGPIACLGHECIQPLKQTEANFAKALAQMNLAQDMGNDLNCRQSGINQNVECTIFEGKPCTCLKSIGNIVNCCDVPSGVSLSDYITLMLAMNKLSTQLTVFNQGSAFYGAWKTLKTPLEETWSNIMGPLSSKWDALISASPSQLGLKNAVDAASSVLQSLTNKTAQWVGEAFGANAQSALFSNLGGVSNAQGVIIGGDFYLGQMLGSLLSGVMTVYTIYSVSILMLKIIWPCHTDEFELGVKRALKSCHAVGSYCHKSILGKCIEKKETYCCYSSPLARIFQEQAKPLLNLDFGQPKDPSCEGLTIEQLGNIDTEQLNLDEWIAILGATGKLSSLESIDLDSLTGSRILNDEKNNIIERLIERLE